MVKLKQYLERSGISQKEAAASLGIDYQWMNAIMNGRKEPGPSLRKFIAMWSAGAVPDDEDSWPPLAGRPARAG
jgi:transcriptional regulator with XRE-family HTH domain